MEAGATARRSASPLGRSLKKWLARGGGSAGGGRREKGGEGGGEGLKAKQILTPSPYPLPEGEGSSSSPQQLEAVRAEIGNCQRCKLAPTRTNIVFGSGSPNAELVFVGE